MSDLAHPAASRSAVLSRVQPSCQLQLKSRFLDPPSVVGGVDRGTLTLFQFGQLYFISLIFFFLVNSNPRFFVSVLNSCKALTHLSSESCSLNQNLSAFGELCGDEPLTQELHFPFPSLQVSTKNINFHTMTSYPLILRLRRCGRLYVTRN